MIRYDTTEESLYQFFSRYGKLQSVHLVRDLGLFFVDVF